MRAKMDCHYSGTESLRYWNWNRYVCLKRKCEVDRPSRSIRANLSRSKRVLFFVSLISISVGYIWHCMYEIIHCLKISTTVIQNSFCMWCTTSPDRGRLLLRTPGPVPLGLAYVLLVETNPFPNLSLFDRTMLFEYPSVLSRFCLLPCTPLRTFSS